MPSINGPVVFIDDEVSQVTTDAYALAKQIRESGRPISEYSELPPYEHFDHWRSISFLVLDWDLAPYSPGMTGGSTLSDFARSRLFDWLEHFIGEVYCPIFIISAEDVDDISRQLNGHKALSRLVSTNRLKVFSKRELMKDFIGPLENWIESTPALAALNIWENENEEAKNRLFQDMDKLEPTWPTYVWQNAEKDSIDPSYELASVISANLLHRMNAMKFEVKAISEFDGTPNREAMRRVTHGRTTLLADRLYDEMILPGDLFSDPESDDVVWVNVTPACQTVIGRDKEGNGGGDNILLNLVRGERLDPPPSKKQFKKLEKDHSAPNNMIVHAMLDDSPYFFSFKVRSIKTWGDVSRNRIGRLLPPYITRLQQMHSAFLVNEGLPRVDDELYLND